MNGIESVKLSCFILGSLYHKGKCLPGESRDRSVYMELHGKPTWHLSVTMAYLTGRAEMGFFKLRGKKMAVGEATLMSVLCAGPEKKIF